MKRHIDAIRALVPAAYTSYYVEANPLPTPPYVIIWSSAGVLPAEVPVAGSSDLTDTIGVTCVGQTPEAALIVLAAVRAALDGSHPAVTGRATWLTLVGSQPVTIDTDVTIPNTTRHPAYGVDLYTLVSTPA